MKARLILTVVMLAVLMVFTNCTADSGTAVMCVETNTADGWQMSVQKLNGTKTVNLNSKTDGKAYTADVKVSADNGTLVVEFIDKRGNAVFTSDIIDGNETLTAELPASAYKMRLSAEDFGGMVEASVSVSE